MDKESFKKRKDRIQAELASLREDLLCLQEEYITSNQKFPIGSKVCITTPGRTRWMRYSRKEISVPEKKRYAYISGYEIQCDKVVPILRRLKDDGTFSKIRDYVSLENEVIELA